MSSQLYRIILTSKRKLFHPFVITPMDDEYYILVRAYTAADAEKQVEVLMRKVGEQNWWLNSIEPTE